MKYALVQDIKTEATKGAKGICPSCGSELIAKCGEERIHHWAHKGNRRCDLWWENETEWHRAWKGHFPVDWQERVHLDESGEKHIADVRTDHGLVIEFQHSFLNPEERKARENFYQNMVWVVDGTRLKRDYNRFLKGQEELYTTYRKGMFSFDEPEEYLPKNWLESTVPVVFDFLGTAPIGAPNDLRNTLYCLFSERFENAGILAQISRKAFIKSILNGQWIKRTAAYRNTIKLAEQDRKQVIAQRNQALINLFMADLASRRPRRTTRRRYYKRRF